MPLVSYFVVVGGALLALLFAADYALPHRDLPVVHAAVPAVPKRTAVVTHSVPILSVREAPAPDMTSEAVRLARADVAPGVRMVAGSNGLAGADGVEVQATTEAIPKRKVVRFARRHDDHAGLNAFALGSRREVPTFDPGRVW